jgi:serine phosphatase RsbU (regulator of sigma subunit)
MELPLWPLISRNRLEVLPLSGDRLRAALVEPAATRGVTLDPVLLDRLVTATAAEPGSLPFVQLVMQELWNRQRDLTIPLEPYEELGGLQAAAARCANDAYRDLEKTWSQNQKAQGAATVRRLFVRLVDVTRDGRETRRQQSVAELRGADSGHLFDAALSHFIDRRLLVSSVETDAASGSDVEGEGLRRIDLAHESLITAWSTLRDWLTEVRDVERRLRELAGQSSAWNRARTTEPRRGLLDRYELADAENTIEIGKALDLGPSDLVAAFVAASRDEVDRQDAAAREALRRDKQIAQREGEVQAQLAQNVERMEALRNERDLRIAAEVQQALLPKPSGLPDFAEAAFASIPCRSIGGDYYDYRHDEDALYFTFGDVAGKGPPAAIISAFMQGMMTCSGVLQSPAGVVRQMNTALLHRELESRFVTLMFGRLAANGELTYCNANLTPPFVKSNTGFRRLETGGLVVGLIESVPYEEEVLQLEPGDIVVTFSDGVTEALNKHGEEFGDARVQDLIEQGSNDTPQELVDRILAAVRSFTQEAPQSDDISLMVVRYVGLKPQ